MKRNFLVLLVPIALLLTTHAQANSFVDKQKFYGKIFSGANFLQDTTLNKNKSTYDPGYIIAGSLGYDLCYGLRIEGEYAYRNNEIRKIHFFGQGSSKHGHLQTSSYMANLLWDLPFKYCDIHPFVGIGIGYDRQQMHAKSSRINFQQKWNNFSWQLVAGICYPIFCNTDLSLEYRFHDGGNHFYNHSIGLGISYKFFNWL